MSFLSLPVSLSYNAGEAKERVADPRHQRVCEAVEVEHGERAGRGGACVRVVAPRDGRTVPDDARDRGDCGKELRCAKQQYVAGGGGQSKMGNVCVDGRGCGGCRRVESSEGVGE